VYIERGVIWRACALIWLTSLAGLLWRVGRRRVSHLFGDRQRTVKRCELLGVGFSHDCQAILSFYGRDQGALSRQRFRVASCYEILKIWNSLRAEILVLNLYVCSALSVYWYMCL